MCPLVKILLNFEQIASVHVNKICRKIWNLYKNCVEYSLYQKYIRLILAIMYRRYFNVINIIVWEFKRKFYKKILMKNNYSWIQCSIYTRITKRKMESSVICFSFRSRTRNHEISVIWGQVHRTVTKERILYFLLDRILSRIPNFFVHNIRFVIKYEI